MMTHYDIIKTLTKAEEKDIIAASMLDSYNADTILREKVRIRRLIRPLFVIGTYSTCEKETTEKYIKKIKATLL